MEIDEGEQAVKANNDLDNNELEAATAISALTMVTLT